jgi:DNA-binding XRE family transcriptional regulator
VDGAKVGALICGLRKEKGLTQKQLAQALHLSDRTISKWERGQGLPDVSLLGALSAQLGIRVEQMLEGDLQAKDTDGGNMKRVKFYVCPNCGNLLTSTGEADVSCCGRKIPPLTPQMGDEAHHVTVETVEDDFYLTFSHEMRKDHYFNFVAYVDYDRVLLIRLYPEQGGEVRFPKMHAGTLYVGCSQHGLFRVKR